MLLTRGVQAATKSHHSADLQLPLYRLAECTIPNADGLSLGLGLHINRQKLTHLVRVPLSGNLEHIFRGKHKLSRFIRTYQALQGF